MQEKSMIWQTPRFQLIEIEIKGKKKVFIEGYLSTTDIDDYNDVVTKNAQQSIVNQVKSKQITMDLEHEEFSNDDGSQLESGKTRPFATIPIGKVIEAELREKGAWVKCELNTNSPRFKSIVNSIKEGFLHSFSIGYIATRAITKKVGNSMMRFIDDLNLLNATITGVPVNPNATFRVAMKAALKSMEENKMSENDKQPEEPVVEQTVEKQSTEPKESVSDLSKLEQKVDDLKKIVESQNDALKKYQEELIESKKEQEESKDAEKSEEPKEIDIKGPLSQLKSLTAKVKENDKLIADLKARLNKPVLKSKVLKETPSFGVDLKMGPLDQLS